MKHETKHLSPFRERIYEIIFEVDTREGKLFDIILLVFILASVVVVALETVQDIDRKFHTLFKVLEWIFTVFFTIEYILRIYSVRKPIKYITSFYGVVDLLSVVPTYASVIFTGTHSLLVIRALRLLRVFRIFKLGNFLFESQIILKAMKESRDKITVFLLFILIAVTIFGSVMYLVEGGSSGFDSIPRGIYWAIVTLTTVGYGDISPATPLGQFIAAMIMILGYSVIAVPTGIVGSELSKAMKKRKGKFDLAVHHCPSCMKSGHDTDAEYCKYCGDELYNQDYYRTTSQG